MVSKIFIHSFNIREISGFSIFLFNRKNNTKHKHFNNTIIKLKLDIHGYLTKKLT